MKYAIIRNAFNSGFGELQGPIESKHTSLKAAQKLLSRRQRAERRINNCELDLSVIKVTWTNGEDARGPLATSS